MKFVGRLTIYQSGHADQYSSLITVHAENISEAIAKMIHAGRVRIQSHGGEPKISNSRVVFTYFNGNDGFMISDVESTTPDKLFDRFYYDCKTITQEDRRLAEEVVRQMERKDRCCA